MADIEQLQAELQSLRTENAQLKKELHELTANQSEKSVFQILNEYDISEHVKKKDKITYLPWSKAWMILRTLYPDAKVEVVENSDFDGDERRYFTDGKTAWVKVSITIKGHTETECLAVMDFRNKSIPVGTITSADVEKSIKRCMVKCAALHGLGISLWTGEELSSAAKEKKEKDLDSIKESIIHTINGKLKAGIPREQVYKVLDTVAGTRNPNAIRDIPTARKVAGQIKKLEVKHNAE